MHSRGNAGFAGHVAEVLFFFAAAGDDEAPRWCAALFLELGEGAQEYRVAFHGIQVADGHDEQLVLAHVQLATQRGALAARHLDSVRHHANGLVVDAEGAAQVGCRGARDGGRGSAVCHRPPQRGAAAPRLGVIAPAVHRDDVSRPGAPRGDGAVHRHRELMAVHHLGAMALHKRRERRHAGPIERSAEHVGTRREPARGEFAA